MKKLYYILIVFALCIAFCSCDIISDEPNNAQTGTETIIESKTGLNTEVDFETDTKAQVKPPRYICGFEGSNLYVIIDGNRVIYERYQPGTDSFTKKDELGLFIVDNEIEGVAWYVYSTEEYPDLSYLLIISGTNSSWTYRIANAE